MLTCEQRLKVAMMSGQVFEALIAHVLSGQGIGFNSLAGQLHNMAGVWSVGSANGEEVDSGGGQTQW